MAIDPLIQQEIDELKQQFDSIRQDEVKLHRKLEAARRIMLRLEKDLSELSRGVLLGHEAAEPAGDKELEFEISELLTIHNNRGMDKDEIAKRLCLNPARITNFIVTHPDAFKLMERGKELIYFLREPS